MKARLIKTTNTSRKLRRKATRSLFLNEIVKLEGHKAGNHNAMTKHEQ